MLILRSHGNERLGEYLSLLIPALSALSVSKHPFTGLPWKTFFVRSESFRVSPPVDVPTQEHGSKVILDTFSFGWLDARGNPHSLCFFSTMDARFSIGKKGETESVTSGILQSGDLVDCSSIYFAIIDLLPLPL